MMEAFFVKVKVTVVVQLPVGSCPLNLCHVWMPVSASNSFVVLHLSSHGGRKVDLMNNIGYVMVGLTS